MTTSFESSYSIVGAIKNLSDRVNTREASDTVTTDAGTVMASVPLATPARVKSIIDNSQPTNLNRSTDVGARWVNSTNGTVQWWDGFQFRAITAASANYIGGLGLEAWGPAAVSNGLSSIRVYAQSATPAQSLLHLWKNTTTGVLSYSNGTSWITVTDPNIIAAVNAATRSDINNLSDGYVTVYYQTTAPAGLNATTNVGDLWYESDTNFDSFRWNGAAWVDYLGDTRTNTGTDGSPPGSSPIAVVTSGFGSLFITWDPVSNVDAVLYDVYLHTATPVPIDEAHKLGTVNGTIYSTTTDATGAALVAGTNYYARIVAWDEDGYAPAGATSTPAVQITDGVNQTEWQQHEDAIDQLNVDLGTANTDISNLQTSYSNVQGQVNTLNNTTIPNLNSSISTAQGQINTLNNTTIPNLNTQLGTAQGQIDTLNNTTIPDMNTQLSTAQNQINTLNNTTIPALQNKFPIVSTDITDGAITTPKMTANSINGDRITANTLNASKIVAGSITTDRMTANSINGDRITANTLNASKIVAGSITSDRMTANTITGDRIQTNTLDAAKIVAGSITTDRMTANSINGDRITANTLDADKIVANSITGDKIAANTITVAKVVMGDTSNMAPDGQFLGGAETWVPNGNVSASFSAAIANVSNKAILTKTTTGESRITSSQLVPVTPGETIAVSYDVWVGATTTSPGNVGIYAFGYDKNGTQVGGTFYLNSNPLNSLTTTPQEVKNTSVVIPAGVYFIRPYFYMSSSASVGVISAVSNLVMWHRNAAELIIDGSITTNLMTANTISGDRIAANTLNASKIVAGSITTDRMTANTISGDRIAANTLNANKIVAGSITTTQMTANTISGTVIAAGTLDASKITAGSITTDRMTANTINGDRITAGTLNASKIVSGSITADKLSANAIDGKTISGVTINAAAQIQVGTAGNNHVRMDSAGTLYFEDSANVLQAYFSGGFDGSYRYLSFAAAGISQPAQIDMYGSGRMDFYTAPGVNHVYIHNGPLEVADDDLIAVRVFASSPDTTTNATNVRWASSGGQFVQVVASSAKKYKENIAPLEDWVAQQGFQVEPISFNYKAKYGWGTEPLWGFLADQVQELGLDRMMEYDEVTGEIESVRYDRWVVILQAMCRNLDQRLRALEEVN